MNLSRNFVERWLPVAYFGVASALVAFLLPTALRPPQNNPTTTAEFAPDAPPEEQPQSVLGDLSRGRSATAGAGGEGEGEAEAAPVVKARPTPPPESRPPRACPHGIGDPPRQSFSLYAPPCAPVFTGDNGGNTHQGVTRNTVRVALILPLPNTHTSYEGPAPREPQPGEKATDRTLRVWQEYFNETYQLWRRALQLYAINSSSSPAEQRADAREADERYKVFGAVSLGFAALDELQRLGIVTFGGFQFPLDAFADAQPYRYAFAMDGTKVARFTTEYMCKKLVGKQARFTGDDPLIAGNERKFGLIWTRDGGLRETIGPTVTRSFEEGCNGTFAEVVKYDNRGDQEESSRWSSAITQMKAEAVTSVVWFGSWLDLAPATRAADAQNYIPEWIMPGYVGMGRNTTAQLYSDNQWSHAFGISPIEMPRPRPASDCYRAYKTVDPNNTPHNGLCDNYFHELQQLVAGIQVSDPELTPESFQQGVFSRAGRPPDPEWAVAGRYAPADPTFGDYVGEAWWDPDATDPVGGRPGAYRWARGGKRYGLGEIPREDPQVFEGGVTCPEGSC